MPYSTRAATARCGICIPTPLRWRVTGFSNSEEDAVGLSDVVPFMLEDALKEKGGVYSKGEDWSEYVLVDGLLVTGQNPGSSEKVAKELLTLLRVLPGN